MKQVSEVITCSEEETIVLCSYATKLTSEVVYRCLSSYDHLEYLEGVGEFQGSIPGKSHFEWLGGSRSFEIHRLRQESKVVAEYVERF